MIAWSQPTRAVSSGEFNIWLRFEQAPSEPNIRPVSAGFRGGGGYHYNADAAYLSLQSRHGRTITSRPANCGASGDGETQERDRREHETTVVKNTPTPRDWQAKWASTRE